MIDLSGKARWAASVIVCVGLGVPYRALAQDNTTSRFETLKNSGGAARNPVRPGATPSAQLPDSHYDAQHLDKDEIAVLSQRNQNSGPEVRGGALSNEHLTYIVIALAAIVLVLVLH